MLKRDVLLSAIKSRIRKTTHKYRIDIPTSIEHGYRLEKENGNNFWRDANATKMHNIGVAFDVLPEKQKSQLDDPRSLGTLSGMCRWTSLARKYGSSIDTNPTP